MLTSDDVLELVQLKPRKIGGDGFGQRRQLQNFAVGQWRRREEFDQKVAGDVVRPHQDSDSKQLIEKVEEKKIFWEELVKKATHYLVQT